MNALGIIQGRLSQPTDGQIQSFPVNSWQEEFHQARDLGLDCIEWVYDTATYQDNPLLTEQGVQEIQQLTKKTGVKVWSVCGDYFRDYPLIRVDQETLEQRLQALSTLIVQCQKAAIGRIMLPFVDHAAISTDAEFQQAVDALTMILPFAQAHDIVITLETALPPEKFKALLAAVNHRALAVTYDIGDRVSLGGNVAEEITLLRPWLELVHLKDRLTGGTTVPPGNGDANFGEAFGALANLNYGGPFILQFARGETGQELETIHHHIEFVQQYTG
ncbi:MAG: sugar phosphate isomerase/epimerase family protein [Chloroflexota bacterium]